jgi:uncharacterized membrane protein
MKNRILLLDIVIVVAVATATAMLYARLPGSIPVHWDINGQVNGYGPRAYLFFHVGLMAAIVLLWAVLPALSPRHFTIDSFAGTWWHMGLIVVGMLAYFQGVLLWAAMSAHAPMAGLLVAGVAVFIGLLGNLMGKVRRNFWIGIRTPWTLASDRVWYATHRLAARTMVGSAVLALLAALIGLPTAVSLGLPIAGTIFPALYSLWLYRRIEGGPGLGA